MATQYTDLGFPYPQTTDVADGPGQLQALAAAIDLMPGISVLTAAQIATLTTAQKRLGRHIYDSTNQKVVRWNGSSWVDADTQRVIASAVAKALGVAAAGSSGQVSDADHVHPMPNATDVGAASSAHTHASDTSKISNALVTAAGQVIASSGSATPVAVAAGSADGQVLTWDTASTPKMKWAAPAATGADSDQTILATQVFG